MDEVRALPDGLDRLGPRAKQWSHPMRNKLTAEFRRALAPVVALAMLATVVPVGKANADAFGECAHQRNLDMKIAACIEASKSTSYPWILQWVYRALAQSQRERGQMQDALANYARSLAMEERDWVRREMEELVLLTQ
jgi:hypothetical protein